MLLPPLSYLIRSTTDGALTAVLVSVVVAFLLLTLLIAGITIGLVLLRRAKRKRIVLEKKGKLVERIEFVEKREEHLEELAAKGGESTAGSNREQRIDDEVALHYERVQREEELHYDSVDVPRQGCVSRVDGGGIRSEADHYYGIDAAENFQMDGVGHGTKENAQQDDQPKGKPDVVYAVVDKSKKSSKGRLRVVLVLPLHRAFTQKSSTMNAAVSLDKIGWGIGWERSQKETMVMLGRKVHLMRQRKLQCEPCNPNAVYAVVDKSKKKDEGKTNSAPSQTD